MVMCMVWVWGQIYAFPFPIHFVFFSTFPHFVVFPSCFCHDCDCYIYLLPIMSIAPASQGTDCQGALTFSFTICHNFLCLLSSFILDFTVWRVLCLCTPPDPLHTRLHAFWTSCSLIVVLQSSCHSAYSVCNTFSMPLKCKAWNHYCSPRNCLYSL